jgi:hypothetical protein
VLGGFVRITPFRCGSFGLSALLFVPVPALAQSFPLDSASAVAISQFKAGGAREAGDSFGATLVAGDFDGDGIDDLAVGAPDETIFDIPNEIAQAGAVAVFPGRQGGLGPGFQLFTSDATRDGEPDLPGITDYFGRTLATGDFDGDGYDDLAVGAPDRGGHILVWPGSASGIVVEAGKSLIPDDFGCTLVGLDEFGTGLAAGDFNGDGYDDLAIGAPGSDSATGFVCIVEGGPDGIAAGNGAEYKQDTHGYLNAVPEQGDEFGARLAAGDLDGDGYDDLVIASPGEAPGSSPAGGMVSVLFGKAGSNVANFFSGGVSLDESDVAGGTIEGQDLFGGALAIGDVDGDGVDDLAVGAALPVLGGLILSARAGKVFVFVDFDASGPAGSALYSELDIAHPGSATPELGDEFGGAVALADLDGDGKAELIVGAHGEGASGSPATSGMIAIFPGGFPLHAGTYTTQPLLLASATSDAGDRFGAALAAGDFDGDGRRELAIGAPGDEAGGVAAGRVYLAPEPDGAALLAASALALAAVEHLGRSRAARRLALRPPSGSSSDGVSAQP